MTFDDSFAEIQADASASDCLAAAVAAVEFVEEIVDDAGWNADAIVGDRNFNMLVFGSSSDTDGTAFVGIFDSIVDKVG